MVLLRRISMSHSSEVSNLTSISLIFCVDFLAALLLVAFARLAMNVFNKSLLLSMHTIAWIESSLLLQFGHKSSIYISGSLWNNLVLVGNSSFKTLKLKILDRWSALDVISLVILDGWANDHDVFQSVFSAIVLFSHLFVRFCVRHLALFICFVNLLIGWSMCLLFHVNVHAIW